MATNREFSIKGEFNFCSNCGRALEEASKTGTCDAAESCRDRAQFATEQALIDGVRRETARLWDRSLRA